MTPRIRVSPAADRDLDEQAGYLAREASPETALRFYDAAAATFEKIARMPGIGELWLSAKLRHSELRIWRVEGFERSLIFYRSIEARIEIVRVLHGARDLERLLTESEPS